MGWFEVYDSDFGSIRFLENLEAFTIARIPEGAEIPPPPADRIERAAGSSGLEISTGPETEFDPNTLSDTPIVPETGADESDTGDSESDSGN